MVTCPPPPVDRRRPHGGLSVNYLFFFTFGRHTYPGYLLYLSFGPGDSSHSSLYFQQMLFLLSPANSLKWVTLASLAQPRRFLSVLTYQPALPVQYKSTTSPHQSGLDMSANKGTETVRSAFQLKTPKGTVDSFGKEVILRDQVT
jgi:hypothetical protein